MYTEEQIDMIVTLCKARDKQLSEVAKTFSNKMIELAEKGFDSETSNEEFFEFCVELLNVIVKNSRNDLAMELYEQGIEWV